MANTTVSETLKRAQSELTQDIIKDAEYILGYVLNWPLSKLIAYPDYVLTQAELEKVNDCLERRKKGEPFAYIKKSKSFWNIELEIDSSVLIPRPETELIIEKIISLNLKADAKILDLGTGSGAIGISLAVNKPNWDIRATDFSEKALAVARSNAKKYQLNNIKFYHGDWFKALSTQEEIIKFDVIVSNPPYISPDSEYLSLGDVRFEPKQALVAQKNGLADLENIILHGKKYLNIGGYLIVEHGYDQAESVQNLFLQGGFADIQTLKDIQGLDRVTFGQVGP